VLIINSEERLYVGSACYNVGSAMIAFYEELYRYASTYPMVETEDCYRHLQRLVDAISVGNESKRLVKKKLKW
jgi:hypothetical protein